MKEIRRKIFLFLEGLSFFQLFLSFILVVLVFGYFYFFLTPGENGVKTPTCENFDIWKGIYFSVVTITTLGYGDMQPLGMSRLLSCVEVLLGISLIGMLIAKLTSTRISYHVKRLYISDSHRQLYGYQSKIQYILSDINKSMQTFSPTFFDTPGKVESPSQGNYQISLERAKRSFTSKFIELSKLIAELKSYINVEVGNGDFLSEISTNAIKEIGNSISGFVVQSYQFLTGISENKRPELLYGETGKHFNNSLNEIIDLCTLLLKHSKENDLKLLFTTIQSDCTKSKNEIIIESIQIFEINPPDQISNRPTDPQTN